MKLRDLDWRFLLPDPGPGGFGDVLLIGGESELAANLVEAGIVRRVHTKDVGTGSVDVIINLAGTAIEPAACRRLRPGGLLYMEVDRVNGPMRRSPAVVKRALETSGLTDVRAYGVVPDFQRPQLRFPLASAHALSWYLRTLFVADNWTRRVLEPALRTVAASPPDMRSRLIPRYAIVAAAGPPHRPFFGGNESLPAALRNATAQPLILTRGDADRSRVAAFPFLPDEREPAVVIKLCRIRSEASRTEGEQRILQRLAAELPPDLASTVPRGLGTISWHGLPGGVESCAPGRVLSATVQRRTVSVAGKIDDLRLAADWLVRLHRGVSLGRTQCQLTPLDAYERAFGLTAAEEHLFAGVRRRHSELQSNSLPRVWQHWGFGEWNVYRGNGSAHVIDWEGGEHGKPLYDLLHFVMHWYAAASGFEPEDSTRVGLEAVFLLPREVDGLAAAARSALHDYLDELGIDRRFLPLLLTLYTAARAVGRFKRGSAVPGADARRSNPFVEEIGMIAEATETLFS